MTVGLVSCDGLSRALDVEVVGVVDFLNDQFSVTVLCLFRPYDVIVILYCVIVFLL